MADGKHLIMKPETLFRRVVERAVVQTETAAMFGRFVDGIDKSPDLSARALIVGLLSGLCLRAGSADGLGEPGHVR